MTPAKAHIRSKALELGADLVGFVRWADLEADAPDYDKPSRVSQSLTTLIVLVKRNLRGNVTTSDASLAQYNNGRIVRHLEEESGELAYWLESQGTMAGVISATMPDLRRQPVGFSSPAGQGSLLLRQAAVRAGLGSLGLNMMLLTPQYGPRVFLSGVLTDLAVEPDAPFTDELCPGAEACGRCAKICPEDAIPTKAKKGAALKDYRALDADACSKSCQPEGPHAMVDQLKRMFKAPNLEKAEDVIREKQTLKIWYAMTIQRQGGFTGCMKCEQVCPIGADYAGIEAFADGLMKI
ncbi:MAG: hypothetical protein L6Q71_03600 [Planctomycetes bacterium]|nr:hypothetical protein [Planctomycetota bacterium]NUQ34531.1 hypothetical protein [Planctomycetaceae bacterium]